MASLSNCAAPQQDCHRHQRHQSPALGPSYDGGLAQEWCSCRTNTEKQYNGIATLLASTVIMLSSLIALLMSSSSWEKSSYLVFGDRTELGFSIKFFSILVCFLFAFLLNLQSVKYYSHASILINVPFKKVSSSPHYHHLAAEHVARTVNRGSYFWSLGLRAFYFSFPLFFWLFGPIPMLLSCFVLVFMLYFLDVTLEFGSAVACSDNDHSKDQVALGMET
ncbi:hypothetical protein I3843_05G187200 [Carya illinoinensis]|nr:hypothetical protein I3843_05G187200 [Carya illinoinensis]